MRAHGGGGRGHGYEEWSHALLDAGEVAVSCVWKLVLRVTILVGWNVDKKVAICKL